MIRSYYVIVTLFFVVVLAALLWAAKIYEDSIRALPQNTAQDFSPFLQRDVIDIPLQDLVQTAQRKIKQNRYIDDLIIRKSDSSGNHTLFPVWYDLEHPYEFPPDFDDLYINVPIMNANDEHTGDLYIKLNTSQRYIYIGAVILSLILIAGLSLYGIFTFQAQEIQVRKTTTLLEEKQRELIYFERLALVGQITTSLLHDIKKPILNIRSELELMQNSDAKRSIQEEVDFFLHLIRDLQLEGFIRKDTPKAEFLDMEEVIERSLKLVRYAQEKVRVHYDFQDELPFIFGHRHQLIQVFSNIFVNAFQALEGEGTMDVSATLLEHDESKWLEITMTDDGPGMPVEVTAYIFEPFFSTGRTKESTGLGLYITKSIVESMGGKIEVHSIPKHGTTFTLRFPVSDEEFL